MPAGSKVDKMYKALLREGKDKATAAKITQARTGQSLQTGRPTKHSQGKGRR